MPLPGGSGMRWGIINNSRCHDVTHYGFMGDKGGSAIDILALTVTLFCPVSYTHLRAHETVLDLVCRLLLEKKNKTTVHCRSASARLLPLPLSTPLPFFFF